MRVGDREDHEMTRGEPDPGGWFPDRNASKGKPSKSDNAKADGWQILGKITKKILGIKPKGR